MIYSIRK